MPRKTRLALIGAALAVASSGVTISMAGVASASGASLTALSSSYVNGNTITVSGTGFPTRSADPSGLEIIECSAAVVTALDASPSYCDGSTQNPLPILTNSSGAFSASYTLSALSTGFGSNITCNPLNPCVLWVGTDYNNDFIDPNNQAFSSSFTVTGSLGFTSGSTDSMVQGASNPFTFSATGNPSTLSPIAVTGALPAGITYSHGVLSGTTYASPASYPLTATVSNATGTVSQNFTLTVTAASAPGIAPVPLTTATVGDAYSQTFSAYGTFKTPIKWKASGKLPKGLKFNKATATISGTPVNSKHVKVGDYNVTISFKDHSKPKLSASESITIDLVS